MAIYSDGKHTSDESAICTPKRRRKPIQVISISGLGDEILKAISANKTKRAQEFNVKQAKTYLRYCEKTGDATLIEFANRKLKEAQLNS